MRILVIGEICEDIFIYGKSERLSPEAPVPVFIPTETVYNDGMAGNVVNNLKAIEKDVHIDHWHQEEKILKTRFVDKKTNHMFIRVDENDISEQINLNQSTMNLIGNSDIVIVSDYDKG